MASYRLHFINNSADVQTFSMYQNDPNVGDPGRVFSLVWFSKRVAPKTREIFDWQVDYFFSWAETGLLAPGVIFLASEQVPTSLESRNAIDLTYQGAFSFEQQTDGPTQGSLFIRQEDSIPENFASIGIGMAANPIYAVAARPSIVETFTPKPNYWITTGDYQTGEVLDVNDIFNNAQIQFPPNVFSMSATLNPDKTWTIQPS